MCDRIGIAVECAVCHRTKKPHGRDSMDNGLCDRGCEGYDQEPQAGSLWPGEKCSDVFPQYADMPPTAGAP